MPHGGTLHVRTRYEVWKGDSSSPERTADQLEAGDPVVVVEVRDTGVGIPEQHMRRVFDPFFTTKRVGAGTGLGLSVAKQIVDLHGGRIDIRNMAGGGVMATLILKATTAAGQVPL